MLILSAEVAASDAAQASTGLQGCQSQINDQRQILSDRFGGSGTITEELKPLPPASRGQSL